METAKNRQKRALSVLMPHVERITNKKWGDSHNYELCVDSSIGVESAAELIFAYVKSVSA